MFEIHAPLTPTMTSTRGPTQHTEARTAPTSPPVSVALLNLSVSTFADVSGLTAESILTASMPVSATISTGFTLNSVVVYGVKPTFFLPLGALVAI